jgi:hypothetical protein
MQKNYTLCIGEVAILWQLVETSCLNMTIFKKKNPWNLATLVHFFPKNTFAWVAMDSFFLLPSDKTKCQNRTIDNVMSSKHSFTLENLLI